MTPPRTISECLVGLTDLPERERTLLDRLASQRTRHPRNTVVFRQGESSDQLLVVDEGQSFTCRYLDDGSRQIIDVHFPGEIIGLDGLSQHEHLSDLVTMTEASFRRYDKAEVISLFAWSPTLSRLLLDVVSRGQAVLTERMVGMARHCALQRVATFLLEFQHRAFRGCGPGTSTAASRRSGSANVLRIPHSIIADSMGLSIVHVSRVLAQLRERGLIGSCGHAITLLDPQGLRLIAGWRSKDPFLHRPPISA